MTTGNRPGAHPGVIDAFTGPWGGLSNFANVPLTLHGVTYPTAEHAYQSAKATNPTQARTIRDAPTPGAARQLGRTIDLREGWDHERHTVMDTILDAKFTTPAMWELLDSTGDDLLIEGNTWHDQHWGQCTCPRHGPWPGKNHLGRALMRLRHHRRGTPAHHWPRVAVTGHRPHLLTTTQAQFARQELDRLATKLSDRHGTTTAISGGALGADTWWAQAALRAGLRLWMYCPFTAQPDQWDPGDQATWAHLRDQAARVHTGGDRYDVRLLHARNDLMIRDADLLISVRRPSLTTGGTASTTAKATRAGTTVITVDLDRLATHIST